MMIKNSIYYGCLTPEDKLVLNFTSLMKKTIPSSVLITDVLLNYSLIELDNQFHQLFPSFSYTRYIQEVIVTTSQEESSFEESLLKVFDSLDLAGKIISIGPGDNAISSNYGAGKKKW